MEEGRRYRTRQKTELFVFFFLFRVLLNGTLAPATLGVGLAISATIAFFFQGSMTFLSDFQFSPRAILVALQYFGFFLVELLKSNLELAKTVLTPACQSTPVSQKYERGKRAEWGVGYWLIPSP